MRSETLSQDGRPIVILDILHDLFPSAVLPSLADALAEEHRVVVIDLAHEGDSPDEYAAGRLAAALEQHLAELDVDDYVAVGHSFNAYHVLNLALRDEHPPAGLVLLGAVARLTDEERTTFPQFADALRAGHDLSDVAADRWVSKNFGERQPDVVEHLRTWLSRRGPAFGAFLEASVDAPDIVDRLAEVEVPTLVRVGSEDLAAPRSRGLATRLPDARLEVVDGVSHLIQWEDRDATAASISSFSQDALHR